MHELKSVYIDRTGDWVRSGNNTGKFYLKSEVDAVIAKLEDRISEERSAKVDYKISANDLSNGLKRAYAEHDKLLACLKCLVMRDLIKDCPEKQSAIKIIRGYK